jgi:hypothetical protein
MTVGAELMALWRALLFRAVAAGAGRCLRAGVRFVAARATRVAGLDQAGFSLMAAVAGHFVGLWMMR